MLFVGFSESEGTIIDVAFDSEERGTTTVGTYGPGSPQPSVTPAEPHASEFQGSVKQLLKIYLLVHQPIHLILVASFHLGQLD